MCSPASDRPLRVCKTCRTRKRACDKQLPSCGYCSSRGHACDYTDGVVQDALSTSWPQFSTSHKLIGSLSLDRAVNGQVDSILKSMDSTPLGVEQRYFRDFHPNLAIVAPQTSPYRFYGGLDQAPADSAVLLLGMLLVSHHLPIADTLYSALRNLTVHVQDTRKPSIALVQVHLLIGCFEYSRGWLEKAFVSVGVCVSLARIIGIDVQPTVVPPTPRASEDLAEQEAWNLWWGIILLESVVLSESPHISSRHLAEDVEEDVSLPSDLVDPQCAASRFLAGSGLVDDSTGGVGGFGRQAQAVLLLDKAVKLLRLPLDSETRLSRLKGLDKDIKDLLALLLKEVTLLLSSRENAVVIAVRSLFLLHEDLVDKPQPLLSADDIAWARATLDTVVTMLVDVAHDHMREPACPHALPFCCAANLQSTAKHMARCKNDGFKQSDVVVLRDLEVAVCSVWRCGSHI